MKANEIAAQLVERELTTRRLQSVYSAGMKREVNKITGPREPLLDSRELCVALTISQHTLRQMIKDGLPFFAIRGTVRVNRRFKMSEVEAWLRANAKAGMRDAEAA